MIDLETLICKAPSNNSAFYLPEPISVQDLIKKCQLIGTTGYVDLVKVNMASLSERFSEFEIIVLTNVENLRGDHELHYRLSCLLDMGTPYVLYVVNDKDKFKKLQYDKVGPLYLRWFWVDNFELVFNN